MSAKYKLFNKKSKPLCSQVKSVGPIHKPIIPMFKPFVQDYKTFFPFTYLMYLFLQIISTFSKLDTHNNKNNLEILTLTFTL